MCVPNVTEIHNFARSFSDAKAIFFRRKKNQLFQEHAQAMRGAHRSRILLLQHQIDSIAEPIEILVSAHKGSLASDYDPKPEHGEQRNESLQLTGEGLVAGQRQGLGTGKELEPSPPPPAAAEEDGRRARWSSPACVAG